ncbi:MAG: glycosyltransferase [Ekhidna sp.]|nr:glycosyltransferase [Ekhidna sp.]MBC6409737.1 glycosyltransferase [Ekhidna sp.]
MKNILILSLSRHDDVNTSATFELAREFSGSNRVLIVEHPYTWTELLRGLTGKKGWIRLIATLSSRPLIRFKGRVHVLVPPAVSPTNFLSFGKWYGRLSRRNHRAVAKCVNSWLLKEKWKHYYYINSYNYHFPDLNKYMAGQCLKHVYHCVDPIVKPYTVKHGIRNQERAVENADLVISTAPQLQHKWNSVKPSFTVLNGVNHHHFNSPRKCVPAVRSLGKKLIGYFGAIERRINYEMLIATFKTNPDWTLVMAGPVQDEYVPAEIREMPNVHFIGKYTYDELPSLIYSVDVAMIPFKIEEAAGCIYPLKLYEYMSTGKPVVSTLFNSDLLIPIADKVHIAKSADKLNVAIENALNEKDNKKQLRRKSFAAMNTWEHRAKIFLNYLNK